jgi:CheY-like chemotaxis protein
MGKGSAESSGDRALVLLVDDDVESRRQARRLLEQHGQDVVQASNGIAALELVQRLPRSFRLVVTEIDLPGVTGAVVVETLRLFRPDLPVLCLLGARSLFAATMSGCLVKPLRSVELRAAVEAALAGVANAWEPRPAEEASESAVARARARFAATGDLVEAALALSRGADSGA